MPAYSTDKGFTGSAKDKDKNKVSGSTGAGTKALTQARDPAGPKGAISGGSTEGPGAKSYSTKADRGGGTTTQDAYTPGAVENHPLADSLTVVEKIFAPLAPGVGSSLGALTAAKQLLGDSSTVFGGDPGPQRGWQPDKYRGEPSLTGIGGSGGAVNSGSGMIPGRSYGGTGDDYSNFVGTDPLLADGGGGEYSDVVLQDRRKPYAAKLQQLLA